MNGKQRWFGPSREDVWRDLTRELDARYDAEYVDGGFWTGDKVEVTHAEWTITLDRHFVPAGKVMLVFTRLRAPYVNPDGFRFTVSRAGFFRAVGERLGFHDVRVGHEPFDDQFHITGTSDERLQALFGNTRLRELLQAQPNVHFGVEAGDGWLSGRKLPPGTDELEFDVLGELKDIERLKLLFDLFAETLDQLCEIGSAYETAPDLSAR